MLTTSASASSAASGKATRTSSVGLDGIEHLIALSASTDPRAHDESYEGSAGPAMVRATQSDSKGLARSGGVKRYREPMISNRHDGCALNAARHVGTPGMKEQE